MRLLTKKQKEIIRKEMRLNKDIRSNNDLSNDVLNEIQKLNDTEILYQEIDRYIQVRRLTN
jgi:hypothetical protein